MAEATTIQSEEVKLKLEELELAANLTIPENAMGIVVFAHGSGSSRFSPRNRAVARTLNEGGLATLLLDLLTMHEQTVDERTGHLRFDIPLLADRLVGAIDWVQQQPQTLGMKIGLFGASTGAAAALVAAAQRPGAVRAVVSRGGRPDLATGSLPDVRAPVLLIVGGDDLPVIDMNVTASQLMRCKNELMIIPGATHLFEESGKLEEVARLACEWFGQHIASGG